MLFEIAPPPKFAKLSSILWNIWKFRKRISADQTHSGEEGKIYRKVIYNKSTLSLIIIIFVSKSD